MASKHATKAIEQFFFKGGATQALFHWLDFRLFVSQKNAKLTPSNDMNSAVHSTTDYLKTWQQQASLTTPATGILRVVAVIAFLIGFTAMAGVFHLGYMYVLQGNVDSAKAEFIKEKQLYPESAEFIDGMLKRMSKGQES